MTSQATRDGNQSLLAEDWIMTLIAMAGSGMSGDSDSDGYKGSKLEDMSSTLNVPMRQIETIIWLLASSGGKDGGYELHLQKPGASGSEAIESITLLSFGSQEKPQWRKAEGVSARGSLADYAAGMLDDGDNIELGDFYVYVDIGKTDDFFNSCFLVPTTLAQESNVMIGKNNGSETTVIEAQPYGRSVATKEELDRIEQLKNSETFSIVYDDSEFACSVKTIFPRDALSRRIVVGRADDGYEIVFDLNEAILLSSGRYAPRYAYVHTAAQLVPTDRVDAVVDFWDIPPVGCSLSAQHAGNTRCGLFYPQIRLRFGEFAQPGRRGRTAKGNVLNKVRDLQGRPGQLSFFDDEGNEATPDNATVVEYIAVNGVYTNGSLQRYILAFGADCLVVHPQELQRWHIDNAWRILQRFDPGQADRRQG